mgnify:CR=1 FL=1
MDTPPSLVAALCLSLIGLVPTATAASVVPQMALLEDTSRSLRIEQVVAEDAAFKPVSDTPVGLGLSRSAWWLRVVIPPSGTARLLSLPYSQNDDLTLYRPRAEGGWTVQHAGDHHPLAEQALPHPHPLFTLAPGFSGTLYLRAASTGSINLPLSVWDERTFWRQNLRNQLAFGYGGHMCLGQHLAILEVECFFRELLPRLDWIEFAGEPEWVQAMFVGGLKSMPVRYAFK